LGGGGGGGGGGGEGGGGGGGGCVGGGEWWWGWCVGGIVGWGGWWRGRGRGWGVWRGVGWGWWFLPHPKLPPPPDAHSSRFPLHLLRHLLSARIEHILIFLSFPPLHLSSLGVEGKTGEEAVDQSAKTFHMGGVTRLGRKSIGSIKKRGFYRQL